MRAESPAESTGDEPVSSSAIYSWPEDDAWEGPPPEIGPGDVVEWISGAVASGVLGNVSHELLKHFFNKIFNRDKNDALGMLSIRGRSLANAPVELLDHMAKTAVVLQCVEVGITAPRLDDLHVGAWKKTKHARRQVLTADVKCYVQSIEAQVWVPERDLPGRGVDVQIRASHLGPTDVV